MALIADIFEVVLIDSNGDAIGTTSLEQANIDVSVNENDVRAGRGNELRAILHSDRDINISLTDVEFRYDWLAKQLGQDIKTGAGVGYAMPKWYKVDATSGITLVQAPVSSDEGLVIYTEDGQKLSGFTVTGSDVDLSGATPTVAEGDNIEVRTYKYDTDSATETIEIDNSVFAKGVQAVLETLEINEDEVPTHKIQYQFSNCLPSGNFTIETSSEKTANTQGFTLRVVKPKTDTKVGKVLRIPVVE